MHARTLALSLAPLLAASLAHAQAPGEVAPQVIIVAPGAPVVAPVPMAPVAAPAVVCGSPRESVMENRWSLGFSLGSMSLAPDAAPDDKTAFAVGELALRFRATPHLELELAVGGGREHTADNQVGDLEVTTAALAARYRFRPEAAWNWFLMAGLGGASVTRHDATDQERNDATRPLAMFGIGIERRFRHLALQAEARAIGIGDKNRNGDAMAQSADVGLSSEMSSTSAPVVTDQKRAGGAISIGLSYYF